MPKTIRLAVYFNDKLRALRELAVPFVIGRSREANLTIPHPMVSRRHCLVFEDRGTIRLQDLGSLNGTFSGTERIQDKALQDGDEFTIGNIRFVFNPVLEENSAAVPATNDSSFIHSEIVLEPSSDLPPPLPMSVKPETPARPTPSKPPTSEQSPPGSPGSPTTPSFIKPLPLSLTPDERENGIIELGDVIDLAKVADKKASTPPPSPPREQT